MSDPPRDDQEELARLVRQAVDIVCYAPIGALIDGPSLLPKLAEQGKVHVHNAQMLGRMALQRGRAALGERLDEMTVQATDLLRMFGLVPDEVESAPDGQGPKAAPADRPERRAAVAGPDVDELAIPDYDSLSASQVVNRLPGLSGSELQAVRDYEAAHRGRKTILNKVAQLQS